MWTTEPNETNGSRERIALAFDQGILENIGDGNENTTLANLSMNIHGAILNQSKGQSHCWKDGFFAVATNKHAGQSRRGVTAHHKSTNCDACISTAGGEFILGRNGKVRLHRCGKMSV